MLLKLTRDSLRTSSCSTGKLHITTGSVLRMWSSSMAATTTCLARSGFVMEGGEGGGGETDSTRFPSRNLLTDVVCKEFESLLLLMIHEDEDGFGFRFWEIWGVESKRQKIGRAT